MPGSHAQYDPSTSQAQQVRQLLRLAGASAQDGDLDVAAARVEQALCIAPDDPDALHLMGLLRHRRGDPAGAVGMLRRAVEQAPASAGLWETLALLLRDTGHVGDALWCQEELCRLAPENFRAWHELGEMCLRAERLDEAARAFEQALSLRETLAGTWNNLGNVRRLQHRGDEAVACYRRAIALKPDFAEAHFNLGSILQLGGRVRKARQAFATALQHRPDYTEALTASTCLEQEVCAWDGRADKVARVVDGTRRALQAGRRSPLEPFCALGLPVSAALQRDIACSVADAVAAQPRAQGGPLHRIAAGTRPPRLRVGYVSSDFRDHATAQLMRGLFRLHDRDHFEVFAYSFGTDDRSDYRRGIAADCDHFIDIAAASTRESAERVAADGIHILIDLKGYTREIRPQLFALRPAPVQVNWLGFPGTTGAPYMDYVITDAVVTPPELVGYFSEAPVFLPDSYQVNDHLQPIDARTPTRAECGLPEQGFVFCCFNNNYKIEPEIFSVWMRLLEAVPGSVLWLLRTSAESETNLRREAEHRGVNGDRLVFADRQPRPTHLARHRCADLFLDTLYCNAHTTASDALWAGLPLLTCPGETFAARVAASLLHAVGLPELVVDRLESYERMALDLAQTRARLAELRTRLERNRHGAPLFDTPRFTGQLESAFQAIWARWVAGLEPASITVGGDGTRP
jgi:protein O-GlcNAc transferase